MYSLEVNKALKTLGRKTGAFCQLFVEEKTETTVAYSGQVDDLQVVRSRGAGLRMMSGETSIYTYSSDTTESGLMSLIENGEAMFPDKVETVVSIDEISSAEDESNEKESLEEGPNRILIDPRNASMEQKIHILKMSRSRLEEAGLKGNFRFQFTDVDQVVRMLSSEAEWKEDRRVNSCVRLYYELECSQDGGRISSWMQYVRAAGLEAFETEEYQNYFVTKLKRVAAQPVRIKVEKGKMPVVIAASAAGTFWHECCGHQLEATSIVHHGSDFEGKLGEKVASDLVTLVDDGTCKGLYGSSVYDDEGNPRQKNVLIENGILKQYMCDEYHGRLLGTGSNGCGRRQNYTFDAQSRMSNTYLAPGTEDPEEIIRHTPYGLYVKELGGGSGGKVFSILCTEGYMIRDGQLAEPVENCMLTARGMDLMMRVDHVGNDLTPEECGGEFCGAGSGLVPVTAFGPTFSISEMEVG